MTSTTRKRSVMIAGHRTSVSLEEPFWEELREIAGGRGQSMAMLIGEIDLNRTGNLSSALRVFVLEDLKRRSQEVDRPRAPASSLPADATDRDP